MKKLFIMVAILIISTVSFPFHLLASQNLSTEIDSEKKGDEYNELGIKKGTKVYGEDISKLTEEELQYIPKDWRDGVFEEEHKQPPMQRSLFMRSVYPNVNDYIRTYKLSTPEVEYDYKEVLPEFDYRYGKPEGVVAHETANNYSTITGEISYMTRNYGNAFVHGYVDDSNIIEVHPTKYGAWGAGHYANERFIHVELVRVHNFDKFARSINNYAAYIASLLYKYDLGVTSADENGQGTLWSHKAVSKFLGGTTHVDPHGYFAQWGYNWDEFVELVKMKYDNIITITKQSTSKLGHIHSSDVRIYDDLSNMKNYVAAGSKYANQVYYIKLQATRNGETYYLISLKPSSKTGTIGWINAQDMKVYRHVGVDYKSKSFIISGDGVAYNRAWGDNKNIVYDDLTDLAGETLTVGLTEKVGNNIWYRGYLDGKKVWIHSSYVEVVEPPTIDEVTKVDFTDVPEGSSHHDAIYALVEMGAIKGYSTNTYDPGGEITRSQTAAIFTKVRELPIPTNIETVLKNFSDVDKLTWYAEQIAATYQAGIFLGSNGKFNDGPLTRAQMATVLVKAYNLQDTGVDTGIRLDNVWPSHRENVKMLAQHGITNQFDDFRPYEDATRGQFATFLYKTINSKK